LTAHERRFTLPTNATYALEGEEMAALKQNVVNLDALIPRADLAVGVNSDNVKGVTLNTLEPGTLD
jgi:hypothetical protein